MKNILITGISELPAWRDPAEYVYKDGKKIFAAQTNEACCKYLITEYGHIDNVICLNTKETLDEKITDPSDGSLYSSYGFFCKMISDFCADKSSVPHFDSIEMSKDDVDASNFESSLKSVADKIKEIGAPEDVTLYLDVAGGLRNISILLQQLTKLLGYYGYHTKAYYTSYNRDDPKQNKFHSCEKAYEQLNILDAVNEFITKGSSRQLKDIFGKIDNNEVRDLLRALERFSDAIQLCRVDDLSDILSDMKKALEAFEKMDKSDDNLFILELMIPLIRTKFNLDDSEHNILNTILWCVDNGYLQQALTIYTEKVPEYIFKSGMITVTDDLLESAKEEVRKYPQKSDPYAVLFYDKLLTQKKEKLFATAAEKSFFDENGNICKADNNYINSIEHTRTRILIKMLNKIQWKDYNNTIKVHKRYKDTLGIKPNDNHDYDTIKKFLTEYIDNYINIKCRNGESVYKYSLFQNLIKHMINDRKIDIFLQGLCDENVDTIKKADDIIIQKCNNINNLSLLSAPDGFTINISEYDMKKILWDYVYIKTVRNKANHAITGSIIPDRVIFYYIDCGYDTENTT
ncbi:MAG: TM1812 family CRISPR-associated protein, partial [Ruminiclostridium sp.]|nr:TM1812 family CRISPR-associated protein [Ruminiclostridium sp.]